MPTEFLCISVLTVASGPRVKLLDCKSTLNTPHNPTPTIAYTTDHSKKGSGPVLLLFCVALWLILQGDLYEVLPCVLSLCFSVLLALLSPHFGKNELVCVRFLCVVVFFWVFFGM